MEFKIGDKVQGGSAIVHEVTDYVYDEWGNPYRYILDNNYELWHDDCGVLTPVKWKEN